MNRKLVDAQSNCLKFSRGYALGEIMTPWGVRKIDELMPRNPLPKTAIWMKTAIPILGIPNQNGRVYTESVFSPMVAKRIISQMENRK